MPNSHRSGFTIRDLLILMTVIGIGLTLCLPLTRTAREAARRMQCSNNLKQLGLGCLNYESANRVLPAGWSGPARLFASPNRPIYVADESESSGLDPIGRWSAFVSTGPYIEATSLFSEIYRTAPLAPWELENGAFSPWKITLFWFRCPSDSYQVELNYRNPPAEFGRVNYAFCYGDTGLLGTNGQHPRANRGLFQGRFGRKLSEVKDGLSNTIMHCEIGTSEGSKLQRGKGRLRVQGGVLTQMPGLELSPKECLASARNGRYQSSRDQNVEHWRGIRWGDGAIAYTGFNTILPPNSPSCTGSNSEEDWGYYSASSYHAGGVNACFADGSVRFISNAIDAGDASAAAPIGNEGQGFDEPSPYGIWGALGTYNGGEVNAPID